jgi:hypothetical protein
MSQFGGTWFKRDRAGIGWSKKNLWKQRHLHAQEAIERLPAEISQRSTQQDSDERAACARFAGG